MKCRARPDSDKYVKMDSVPKKFLFLKRGNADFILKRGEFILIITMLFSQLDGQHLSHKVLVPGALIYSTGGYTISQSIGEPVVDYVFNETHALTQGFQQPSVIAVDTTGKKGNGVNVFPNPVVDDLVMELFGNRDIVYQVTIFGFSGAIYYRKDYPCGGNYYHRIILDVRHFQRGPYFVRVVAEDGTIARLFKIEKM